MLVQVSIDAHSFETELTPIVRRCHEAFADLVACIPSPVRTASELQAALQINMKLAWKIHKVASDASLEICPFLPGAQNVRDLIAVAERLGIGPEVTQRIAEAMSTFEQFVTAHAGDRANLESMVCATGSDKQSDALELTQKRSAFRVNRSLRGVQARVQHKTMMLTPSEGDPAMLDIVGIQGYQGLYRLRYDSPLVTTRLKLSNDDHGSRNAHWESLGPSLGQNGPPDVLDAFCTPNFPLTRQVKHADGFTLVELIGGGIGKQSAVDYLDGYIARAAAPRFRTSQNQYAGLLTWVPIPCETLVIDLIVHKDAFGPLNPFVGCYASMLSGSQLPHALESCDRFPLNETMRSLGRGLPLLRSPDLPRHADMYAGVFRRLGWNPAHFDAYRCRVAYPVMLSSILVRFDLPERT